MAFHLFTANYPAARFSDIRDVAKTSGTTFAQSVCVQCHQRRRVLNGSRTGRGAREAGP